MNMFKPVKASNIKEYFSLLPKDRREVITFLDSFIKHAAPILKPHFAYNMLGYGNFKYKNSQKDVLDWPIISLANQKNYISLYICAVDKNGYLAEQYKDKLGKVSVGKSCIRLKRITDLNLDVLERVIKLAEKSPGLIL